MLTAKIAILFQLAIPAQYGGPPMWDRGYENPEYRRVVPRTPPRRFGPQFEPCIYGGDCRGPRYGVPPFRDQPRR